VTTNGAKERICSFRFAALAVVRRRLLSSVPWSPQQIAERRWLSANLSGHGPGLYLRMQIATSIYAMVRQKTPPPLSNVPAQIVATMNRVAFVPALVARLIQPVIDIAAISGTSGLTRPLLPLARRVKRIFEFSRSPSSATR
jgi:hypothetical protein